MSRQNSFHQFQAPPPGPIRSIRSLLKEPNYPHLSTCSSFISHINRENPVKAPPETYLEEVKNEKIKVYIRVRPLDPVVKTYNSDSLAEAIQRNDRALNNIDDPDASRNVEALEPYYVSEGCCVIFPRNSDTRKEKEHEDEASLAATALFSPGSPSPFVYSDPSSASPIYMKETPERLNLYPPHSGLTFPLNPYSPRAATAEPKRFHFPRIFPAATSQSSLYAETLQPLILGPSGVLRGYNSACLVYGQTGSGKTYTMFGNSTRLGLSHLAIRDLLAFNNWTRPHETQDFDPDAVYYQDDFNSVMDRDNEVDEPEVNEAEVDAADEDSRGQIRNRVNKLSLSFTQVYNEQIYDLLDGPDRRCVCKTPSYIQHFRCRCGALKASQNKSLLPPPLALREKTESSSSFSGGDSVSGSCASLGSEEVGGAVVVGCQKIVVGSEAGARDLIASGLKRRKIRSTAQNLMSSRSHAILQLHLELAVPEETDENVAARRGSRGITRRSRTTSTSSEGKRQGFINCTLTLIDLAGSEKVPAYTPPHVTSGMMPGEKIQQNQRLVESRSINKSILELGNCIQALSQRESILRRGDEKEDRDREKDKKRKDFFVPFRNSKLTRLLEEALNGNSKTCIIATLDPSPRSFAESHATLKFANRAKVIKTVFRKNEVIDKTPIPTSEEEVEQEESSVYEEEVGQYDHSPEPAVGFDLARLEQIDSESSAFRTLSQGQDEIPDSDAPEGLPTSVSETLVTEAAPDDDMELLYYDENGSPVYVQKFREGVPTEYESSSASRPTGQDVSSYMYDPENEREGYRDVYASQSFLYSFPASHENFSGQFVFTLKDFLRTVDNIEEKSRDLLGESQGENTEGLSSLEASPDLPASPCPDGEEQGLSPSPQPRTDWIIADDGSPAPLSFTLRSIGPLLDLLDQRDAEEVLEAVDALTSKDPLVHQEEVDRSPEKDDTTQLDHDNENLVSHNFSYKDGEDMDSVLLGDLTPTHEENGSQYATPSVSRAVSPYSDSSMPSTPRRSALITPTSHSPYPLNWQNLHDIKLPQQGEYDTEQYTTEFEPEDPEPEPEPEPEPTPTPSSPASRSSQAFVTLDADPEDSDEIKEEFQEEISEEFEEEFEEEDSQETYNDSFDMEEPEVQSQSHPEGPTDFYEQESQELDYISSIQTHPPVSAVIPHYTPTLLETSDLSEEAQHEETSLNHTLGEIDQLADHFSSEDYDELAELGLSAASRPAPYATEESDSHVKSFEDGLESDLDSSFYYNKDDEPQVESIPTEPVPVLSSLEFLSQISPDHEEEVIEKLSAQDPHDLAVQILELQKKLIELEAKAKLS